MLVAVVGASGAGKDTLMDAARRRLAGDPRFVFLRRVITRPAEAGGEDHRPMTRDAFLAERAAGRFALWWEAHGLLYGIPRTLEVELEAGRVALANLSRAVLAEAARCYPLRVLLVTAPLELRAARLAARGRETAADVARRLTREAPLPDGLEFETICNDGAVEQGAARILDALDRAARDAAARRGGALPPAD